MNNGTKPSSYLSEHPYIHTRMTQLLPEWVFPHCSPFCFMEMGCVYPRERGDLIILYNCLKGGDGVSR